MDLYSPFLVGETLVYPKVMGREINIAADHSYLKGKYGIDGWRLADLEGGHIIDIRVGQGFMIYALVLWDGNPHDWRLVQIDCAVAEVDTEVMQEETVWNCPETVLEAPAKGPFVRLLDPPFCGDYFISHGTIEANTPDTYKFVVHLSDPAYKLLFDEKGKWLLLDENDAEIASEPQFSCGFNVWLSSKDPWWRADDTVELVPLNKEKTGPPR